MPHHIQGQTPPKCSFNIKRACMCGSKDIHRLLTTSIKMKFITFFMRKSIIYVRRKKQVYIVTFTKREAMRLIKLLLASCFVS